MGIDRGRQFPCMYLSIKVAAPLPSIHVLSETQTVGVTCRECASPLFPSLSSSLSSCATPHRSVAPGKKATKPKKPHPAPPTAHLAPPTTGDMALTLLVRSWMVAFLCRPLQRAVVCCAGSAGEAAFRRSLDAGYPGDAVYVTGHSRRHRHEEPTSISRIFSASTPRSHFDGHIDDADFTVITNAKVTGHFWACFSLDTRYSPKLTVEPRACSVPDRAPQQLPRELQVSRVARTPRRSHLHGR